MLVDVVASTSTSTKVLSTPHASNRLVQTKRRRISQHVLNRYPLFYVLVMTSAYIMSKRLISVSSSVSRFRRKPAFLVPASTYAFPQGRSKACLLQHYSEPPQNPLGQDYYNSLDKLRRSNARPLPPVLDSQYDDEEFGGHIHYDLLNEIAAAQEQTIITAERNAIAAPPQGQTIIRDELNAIDEPQSPTKINSNKEKVDSIASQAEALPLGLTEMRKRKVPKTQTVKKTVPVTIPSNPSLNSTYSYGLDSLESVEAKTVKVSGEIFAMNKGKEFNLNSSRQVSQALFGGLIKSTNKDALEEAASRGNTMASLILEYRNLKNKVKYITRKQDSILKGTAVKNALSIVRPRKTKQRLDDLNSVVRNGDNDGITPTIMQEEMTDPLILLDASSYIFRAYYTMPPIHRSDGMPVGAVMGFCKMINSIFLSKMISNEELLPRAALCFDAKGKTFRHEMYPKYKGNRPAAPMDLIPQFDLIRQAAKAYGICQIEAPNYEADDVIATMATMALAEGLDTNIVSGDKDLMQLVTEPDPASPSIQMIDPVKRDRTTYDQVVEKWLVPPDKLGDVLALAGDTVDNVPGVPGIGPKIAADLINEFGSLDNLLNNIDKVPQQKRREKLYANIDQARLSRDLVELNRNVPHHSMIGFPDDVFSVRTIRIEPIDPDRLFQFYDEMGFKELKRTLQEKLQGRKFKRPAAANRRPKGTIPKPEDYANVPF